MPVKVYDFFSGCGGTSLGFRQAGMDVVFALDSDPDAAATFKRNFPEARFVNDKIQNVAVQEIGEDVAGCGDNPILFCGCAPCQPFSKHNREGNPGDRRVSLLLEFGRFVAHYRPDYVFVENVPGLQEVADRFGPLSEFLQLLGSLGYDYKCDVVNANDYGVPQMRRRLVLVASPFEGIHFPPVKTHGPGSHRAYSTVRDNIRDLPPIAAGETHPEVPNHQCAGLSSLNLQRIRNTPVGGGRKDWPDELKLECHTNGHDGHTDVYGRMKWDGLAPVLTTRCISLSNGRFGHPEQDRAISVREAASLQTFPTDFVFEGKLNSAARQVGNAVPVLLARHFGECFARHAEAVAVG